MKILLVTFSDNADHQDTLFGMYEQLIDDPDIDAYLMAIAKPRVPLKKSDRTWLVDCPERPGICRKTFFLHRLLSIVKRIRKEQFDAIYFESLHIWNLPIMMLKNKKTRIYHVIHEVVPHEGDSQEKLVNLMNKALVKLADIIVLRNKTYIGEMIRRYNVPEERISFLELWRRYPAFTMPVYSKRVLFFGRINPYKGADNMLQLARLCPQIQFDVVGRIDAQMESVVDAMRAENNIVLDTKYVSEERMREDFLGADWVVVPYNSASQSGVIIDAYKYSRPVIAFCVGAIKEQIADEESGFLIEPGNVEMFAQKLKEVVGMDKERYTVMCKQAYAYGSKKYAASGAKERFKKIFN